MFFSKILAIVSNYYDLCGGFQTLYYPRTNSTLLNALNAVVKN